VLVLFFSQINWCCVVMAVLVCAVFLLPTLISEKGYFMMLLSFFLWIALKIAGL